MSIRPIRSFSAILFEVTFPDRDKKTTGMKMATGPDKSHAIVKTELHANALIYYRTTFLLFLIIAAANL